MARITLDTVVSRAQGFTTAPVHDELMMLNVEQGAYYSLDPIAAEIWSMLEEPTKVRTLAVGLEHRYAVTLAQCQADVLEFLEEMLNNAMIVTQ